MQQWVEALQEASYEHKRLQLILLQIKIRAKTGVDPLIGTNMESNPIYSLSNLESTQAVQSKEFVDCRT